MNMTETEYRDFLSTFTFTLNYLKKWINESVLKRGVRFPYNTSEFNSNLQFQEKSMHFMIEVEDGAAEVFEEDLWSPLDWSGGK